MFLKKWFNIPNSPIGQITVLGPVAAFAAVTEDEASGAALDPGDAVSTVIERARGICFDIQPISPACTETTTGLSCGLDCGWFPWHWGVCRWQGRSFWVKRQFNMSIQNSTRPQKKTLTCLYMFGQVRKFKRDLPMLRSF